MFVFRHASPKSGESKRYENNILARPYEIKLWELLGTAYLLELREVDCQRIFTFNLAELFSNQYLIQLILIEAIERVTAR